jgi:hypothetical protein
MDSEAKANDTRYIDNPELLDKTISKYRDLELEHPGLISRALDFYVTYEQFVLDMYDLVEKIRKGELKIVKVPLAERMEKLMVLYQDDALRQYIPDAYLPACERWAKALEGQV